MPTTPAVTSWGPAPASTARLVVRLFADNPLGQAARADADLCRSRVEWPPGEPAARLSHDGG